MHKERCKSIRKDICNRRCKHAKKDTCKRRCYSKLEKNVNNNKEENSQT